jgi:hypothetical protein
MDPDPVVGRDSGPFWSLPRVDLSIKRNVGTGLTSEAILEGDKAEIR